MSGKVAKQLRKKAFELADNEQAERNDIIYRRRVRGKPGLIEKFITRRYREDTPIQVYRKLKKEWNRTPRPYRKIDNV